MEYSLTIACAALFAFILGGIRFIIFRPIEKRRKELLESINGDTEKLLENSRELIKHNKRDFIQDLNGLYLFEVKLKKIEKDYSSMFLSMVVIAILVIIFEMSGALGLSLITFFMLGFIFSIEFAILSFYSLYSTIMCIDIYDSKKQPREIVRKRLLRR